MDSVVTQTQPEADERFDSVRIAAAVDALAEQHAGREDVFRAATAQLLKAEMMAARATAQAVLLKDRHGRRCAEWLCLVQDEIIRILFSAATRHLYRSPVPSGAERMAVVATGGYGRGLMAPESDIDLLFILPYKQTAWGEQVAEAILYCLWDMGLKVGHATRSVDESIRQARGDMTIRTAILETRFLTGDRPLYDELVERFDKEVVQGTAAEFVTAKLAEREERHRRAGQSRYLVEPNVKDGKGGLRDLHTLFWIAKYVYRVRETDELLERGVFDAQEYRTFRRCADFLWSVRCNIHFFSGRAEERLSFDMQREIAIRLGYTSHPGMQDVERFMKHYFLVAKDVGDLTAILCAKLEDQQAKPAPVLSRMMARLRPNTNRRRVPDSDDFIVDNNRINLAAPDVFKHDPVNLIRIFRLAQKNNLAFHPDAMRTVTRSLKLINPPLRDNPEANRLFMEILTSNDAEIVLRRMNETGVLGHFIRAFGKIVSMMQFNMYHHYTVDEHLLRCVGYLQDIERGGNDEFTVASDLMRKIRPEHRAELRQVVGGHRNERECEDRIAREVRRSQVKKVAEARREAVVVDRFDRREVDGAGQVAHHHSGGTARRHLRDPSPVGAFVAQVAAVGVHTVGEMREIGRAPAPEAHRVDLDRGDTAGGVDAEFGMNREVRDARTPADVCEELHRRGTQAIHDLGAREVDPIAHVIGRGEQVRKHVDEHRSAVGVEVGVDCELLARDDLLDDEPVQAQDLLRVDRRECAHFALDLINHCGPGGGGRYNVDAHAEEPDCWFDDEWRAEPARVEGPQFGQRESHEAVVGVQVGHELAKGELVLEQSDAARQICGCEVVGDPADGVL